MFYYCTYFDKNYLYKGLALYRSLERHSPPFVLFALTFDSITFEVLGKLQLPHMRLIRQTDFEADDVRLQEAKLTRSKVEYYWTCTPSLPLYVFAHNSEIDLISYLDADIFFFSDPTPIFEEFGGDSILIIEHRFPKRLRHLEANGIYNVQMMSFRRDTNGMGCLQWWRDRCIEWCYNRLEDGRMGDQKYLDDWPERFYGVHVLQHLGAGVAPWNFSQYDIQVRDGRLNIGSVPLIFYHFHQFRVLTNGHYHRASSLYEEEKPLPDIIYQPYGEAISQAISEVKRVDPSFSFGIDSHAQMALTALAAKYLPTRVRNLLKKLLLYTLSKADRPRGRASCAQ